MVESADGPQEGGGHRHQGSNREEKGKGIKRTAITSLMQQTRSARRPTRQNTIHNATTHNEKRGGHGPLLGKDEGAKNDMS